MTTPPSFKDDARAALLAASVGAATGLLFTVPSGVVAYQLLEGECDGEAWCGLSAVVSAAFVGLVVGALAFVVAAIWFLRKHVAPDRRRRAGLLTFVGMPIVLLALFSLVGLL